MQLPRRMPRKIVSLVVPLLVMGAFSVVAGCGFVSGSGDLVENELDLTGFTRVEVRDTFRVLVTQDERFAVTVTHDDNVADYLEAEVDGDTLHLGLRSGTSYEGMTLEASITLPELQALELGGSSSGRLSGFNELEPLAVVVSGDSTLAVIDLRTAKASLELSGSSDLEGTWVMTAGDFGLSGDSELRLTGAADRLALDVSGSSTCELARFRVGVLRADLSGSSDGIIHVLDALDADLSGASNLEYLGDPTLGSIDTSGSSEVRPAEQ